VVNIVVYSLEFEGMPANVISGRGMLGIGCRIRRVNGLHKPDLVKVR
jgi:hypothetical protein